MKINVNKLINIAVLSKPSDILCIYKETSMKLTRPADYKITDDEMRAILYLTFVNLGLVPDKDIWTVKVFNLILASRRQLRDMKAEWYEDKKEIKKWN